MKLAAFALILAAGPAAAQFLSLAEVRAVCAAGDPRCDWFIAAVADLHNSRLLDVPDPARPCIPRGTAAPQIVAAGRAFLATLPDGAVWTPAEAVMMGLAKRWPCRR